MAGITTVITAIDPLGRPLLLDINNCTLRCGMATKIDLIFPRWHIAAADRRIVNFMLTIRPSVFIDDEIRHFQILLSGAGCVRKEIRRKLSQLMRRGRKEITLTCPVFSSRRSALIAMDGVNAGLLTAEWLVNAEAFSSTGAINHAGAVAPEGAPTKTSGSFDTL